MTATPIPRSLALTAFGDLDISTIKVLPPGRKPVVTHLAREGNESKVYERVRPQLKAGRQAYFVYPLIEETEKSSLKAAEAMYRKLESCIFAEFRIALIHSRIGEEEKRGRAEAFRRGDIDILVATSVVEVGVDVPNATCMVIEHAERFGLSALHQLRGRVGRGAEQSYAYLIYGRKLSKEGVARLRVMMETNDGFRIAEEDLAIRGPGELLGQRQAGFFKMRLASLSRDREALLESRRDVLEILQRDPELLLPEHRSIRGVLEKAPPFSEAFSGSPGVFGEEQGGS
jgi:ATP-dependent DNA helicase RecG